MSQVQVIDEGGGRFVVDGPLTFETAAEALEQSKALFSEYDTLEVDLSQVSQGDSAGLALLLEWVNWAKYYVREIKYHGVPQQILSIAKISEVEELLAAGERWTGPMESST